MSKAEDTVPPPATTAGTAVITPVSSAVSLPMPASVFQRKRSSKSQGWWQQFCNQVCQVATRYHQENFRVLPPPQGLPIRYLVSVP